MQKGVDFIGVGVGAIIFNNEGKVLIAQRGQKAKNDVGKWEFPGGSVEFAETLENAIKREIKEELDIEIKVIELLHVVDHFLIEKKQHWVAPSYIAKLISGVAKINEPEKCSNFKWVNFSQIDPSTLSSPSRSNYKKFIEKYGIDKVF